MKYVPEELRNDKEFVMQLAKLRMEILQRSSKNIDVKTILKKLENELLDHCPTILRNDILKELDRPLMNTSSPTTSSSSNSPNLISQLSPASFEGAFQTITPTSPTLEPTIDMNNNRVNSIDHLILQQLGYTQLEHIANGGFGIVYKALSPTRKKLVALKIVKFSQNNSTQSLLSSLREVLNMARLSHPNVVQIYSAIPPSSKMSVLLIEMELMIGSLHGMVILKRIKMSEKMLIELLRQICTVMIWMKENGIVHRDIKPENILIRKMCLDKQHIQIAFSDFGLAKSMDHTTHHTMAGTQLFMAPELQDDTFLPENQNRFSTASDMFAVGVTLYQLLTFDRITSFATLAKQEMDIYRFLSKQLDGFYSEYLVKIISSMLHVIPSKRITPTKVLEILNNPTSKEAVVVVEQKSIPPSRTPDTNSQDESFFKTKYFKSEKLVDNLYRVTEIKTKKKKALKLIHITSAKDLEFAMNQAKIIAISHENIIRVFDIFAPSISSVGVEMELMQGNLETEFISKRMILSEKILRQIIYQVCDALEYYLEVVNHAHGNIKLENILVKHVNLEFGMIEIVMSDFGKDLSLNKNSKYLAPELMNGSTISSSSDVFALGLCLCQLITLDKNIMNHHFENLVNSENYSFNILELVQSMLHPVASQRPTLQEIMSAVKD